MCLDKADSTYPGTTYSQQDKVRDEGVTEPSITSENKIWSEMKESQNLFVPSKDKIMILLMRQRGLGVHRVMLHLMMLLLFVLLIKFLNKLVVMQTDKKNV